MEQSGEQIEGKILRIIFYNNENNYSILSIQNKLKEKNTAVGYLVHPKIDDEYRLTGKWVNHSKFGKQFQFDSFEHLLPTNAEAIEQYLSSGVVHGIGPALAKRIVKNFGDETLKIINSNPDKLLEVDGIGKMKLEQIKKDLTNVKQMQEVFLFLSSHNVSISVASKIYRTYGQNAIAILKENPYQLITDVFGIGFRTADEIAKSMGFGLESTERILAGAIAILEDASRSAGHTFLKKEEIISRVMELIQVDERKVELAISIIENETKLIEENEKIYLPVLQNSEVEITKNISRLNNRVKFPLNEKKLNSLLKEYESRHNLDFEVKQRDAIFSAITNPITIITGGPGTGKTLCIKGIIELAEILGLSFSLCAPTGRAAKRMTELTGCEAKTIHRLLEYDPNGNSFRRNEEEPLDARLIIVDEMSMVDVQLFASLIGAIKNDAQLILVGDVDQLPSVGPGQVLKDLIESKKIVTIEFSEIFRQHSESKIIFNSHKINHGNAPEFENDFIFFEESKETIQSKILQLASTIMPMNYKFNSINDIQVLSPMHNGASGVRELNKVLQKSLNGESKILWRGNERNFHQGDKVMQIKNNYDKEIYNGDIGFVTDADSEEGYIGVNYYGKRIEYTIDELDEITLAYAMTIHKSQGNEFPAIILPLSMSHYIMLQRNLIYTAVTRAKSFVALVGEKKALSIAIKNADARLRNSTLVDRLKRLL